MLNKDIVAALATLDVDNDDHWTSDGLPRMDVVQDQLKQDITRGDITAAAKGFSRKNPELPANGADKVAESADEGTDQEADQADENADQADQADENADQPKDGSLEEVFAEAMAKLDEARKAREAANKHYAATQDAVDKIIRQKEKGENTQVSNITSIKAFQRSQFELRRRQLED